MIKNTIYYSVLLLLFSKSNTQAQGGIKDCRAMPTFVQKIGFDLSKSAFSTSERKKMGLCFVELSETGENKIYQHPSWKKAGYLSAMAITEKSEIFCVPTPVINTLYNKAAEQNFLYKISANSQELTKVLELPILAKANANNPYGLVGLAYDCDSKVLYASSLMGSTSEKENGVVFAIQTSDMMVIGQLTDIDVMGIGLIQKGNEKRLMLGSTRNGTIQSIALDEKGNFKEKPSYEFSLEGLGQRGDDIAKKIRMTSDGTLTITGIQFYYNLTAPTEKPESKYIFKYIPLQQQWQLLQVQ
jgi:hypothetical protein